LDLQINLNASPFDSIAVHRHTNSFSNIIALIVKFLNDNPSMEMHHRVAHAQHIVDETKRWEAALPPEYQFDPSNQIINSNNPSSFKEAARAYMVYTSAQHCLCLVMQVFLFDTKAPRHLRYAALRYARTTIESMHILVTLSNCPYVSLPPAWNVHHLFTASTTFATVFLSDSEDKKTDVWPVQDLNWFASILPEIVDTFHLVAQGTQHPTARICKNVLIALCDSRNALKERYQERERQMLQTAAAAAATTTSSMSYPSQTNVLSHGSSNNNIVTNGNLDPALRQTTTSSQTNLNFLLEPPLPTLAEDKSNIHFNNFNKDVADFNFDKNFLFDPWEWARLTADLGIQ
jgi:hypothetical protein